MHISSLAKIYHDARSIGVVANSAEFSTDYLAKYREYYVDSVGKDRMVSPWTVATLLASLRSLRGRVGAAVHPGIDALILAAERGLEVSQRYRYR